MTKKKGQNEETFVPVYFAKLQIPPGESVSLIYLGKRELKSAYDENKTYYEHYFSDEEGKLFYCSSAITLNNHLKRFASGQHLIISRDKKDGHNQWCNYPVYHVEGGNMYEIDKELIKSLNLLPENIKPPKLIT